jgi:hypothetical protein
MNAASRLYFLLFRLAGVPKRGVEISHSRIIQQLLGWAPAAHRNGGDSSRSSNSLALWPFVAAARGVAQRLLSPSSGAFGGLATSFAELLQLSKTL